jgi:hypothetical protein
MMGPPLRRVSTGMLRSSCGATRAPRKTQLRPCGYIVRLRPLGSQMPKFASESCDEDKPSNRCVNLHREHPRPPLFDSDFEKVRPRKWPGFTPPRSRKMPPLRGLLLHRRVQVQERPVSAKISLNPRHDLQRIQCPTPDIRGLDAGRPDDEFCRNESSVGEPRSRTRAITAHGYSARSTWPSWKTTRRSVGRGSRAPALSCIEILADSSHTPWSNNDAEFFRFLRSHSDK